MLIRAVSQCVGLIGGQIGVHPYFDSASFVDEDHLLYDIEVSGPLI